MDQANILERAKLLEHQNVLDKGCKMPNEDKYLQYIISNLPSNASAEFIDGFKSGFKHATDLLEKQMEETLRKKDEELDAYKCRAEHAEWYIDDLHNNKENFR